MQLKFTEDIVPVTDFRNNAADVLSRLGQNGRPIVLTQRGRAAAVLLDVNAYQQLTERLDALEKKIQLDEEEPPNDKAPASKNDDFVKELEKFIEED